MKILFLTLAVALISAIFASCDKESQNDEYRRLYPIPTELPEATCEGKNTIGCFVDSILFVANYFPNTSSWGSQTYEGGVRAFIENPDDDYINIIAEHPIRPEEIDSRFMRIDIWWNLKENKVDLLKFQYSNPGYLFGFDLDTVNNARNFLFDIVYDSASTRLCGSISNAPLIEYTARDIGDPLVFDTLTLRDLRLDLPVYMGRY